MQETANNQLSVSDEKSAAQENRLKKQWIKPECGIINIYAGGGFLPDAPDTKASPAS